MSPLFGRKSHHVGTTDALDEIEKIVYEQLKPYGFRRYGRTLHRFVSGDLSQVINFQYYAAGFFVNLGIRIPECEVRTFTLPLNDKEYYHEYNCQIRSRLEIGWLRKCWFDLRQDPQKLEEAILDEIQNCVLPAFDALNSREQILHHRCDYPKLDEMHRSQAVLDETFIYGCRGDLETAKARFDAYYQTVLEDYNRERTRGHLKWLRRGETLTYKDADGQIQSITAKFPHYIRVRTAMDAHKNYLDKLAKELGLR